MIDHTHFVSIELFLLLLAVTVMLLFILGVRTAVPMLLLLGRWLRWILFAGIIAFFLRELQISNRSDWVHFATGLGLWFLIETGYNWIAIKTISQSDFPLFPGFRTNKDGDEWPADKHLIEKRDWLRKKGFVCLNAIKATLFEDIALRALIYECQKTHMRIQLLFIPRRNGTSNVSYIITSFGKGEQRLITDNLFLPFGGYYPEGWNICRRPLIGSLKTLLKLHEKRLESSLFQAIPFDSDPLEEINEQQRILERLNREAGFLLSLTEEGRGKISPEGCYRLWKEMWLIAYFGRSSYNKS